MPVKPAKNTNQSRPAWVKYLVLVIISLALGFAIAYTSSVIKVSATVPCPELCVMETTDAYGLPLPFRSVGTLAAETIDYTGFIIDGLVWSALTFVVILVPMKLISKRKAKQ